ncbi:hypothetical protein D3C78_1551040 [compost metagenome]
MRDLVRAADAQSAAPVHRLAGDVDAGEMDVARICPHAAGDQVEQRALAGAVRPDDAERLARSKAQAHVLGHGERAVVLVQAVDGE